MDKTFIRVLTLTVCLAGCGTTPTERGVSGAGIGASAGAVVGAVTGLGVVNGVLLGAGAGGLTGALTDKSQVNLGEPVWKKGNAQTNMAAAPAASQAINSTRDTVREIQRVLQNQGLYKGKVDGLNGPQTVAAIKSYQQQRGLVIDGAATPQLLTYMTQGSAG